MSARVFLAGLCGTSIGIAAVMMDVRPNQATGPVAAVARASEATTDAVAVLPPSSPNKANHPNVMDIGAVNAEASPSIDTLPIKHKAAVENRQEIEAALKLLRAFRNPINCQTASDALKRIVDVQVFVILDGDAATGLGSLSKTILQAKLEVQLRQAGIRISSGPQSTALATIQLNCSFDWSVKDMQFVGITELSVWREGVVLVPDSVDGLLFLPMKSTVWRDRMSALYGSSRQLDLKDKIGSQIDSFVNDFLKANPR